MKVQKLRKIGGSPCYSLDVEVNKHEELLLGQKLDTQ